MRDLEGSPLNTITEDLTESESFFVLAGTYRIWCGEETCEA